MPPNIRPPAASDSPGLKKLGRYECTEQVGGSGGFETYRARVKGVTGLDRSFAVKVLRLKRSEIPNAVSEPFLQAARRSAALADSHIARVVEADSADGVVFAVTPFMDGADLGQFLQCARESGVLATGKGEVARHWYRLVAYIGAEIACGLQAAHAQEPPVIHGALCPGNVFITSRGAVRLLDFGLRASVRRPFEPRPRRLLPYIAPELAAPAADCTRAGDIYGLGVLLCELSSGELPPQGRRASELQVALSLLPEDLGLLIGRLVSVSPAARPEAADVVSSLAGVYADATEAALVADLRSLIQRSSTDAPEVEPEAIVSLAGMPEGGDDAPPPPSEVEHDDAYGLEGPLPFQTSESARPKPAGQPAVRSVSPPAPPDEFLSSRELTAVGEPALIDDLVAKSRSSAPATSARIAGTRHGPRPLPSAPAASPASVLLPAPPLSSASQEGGSTMRGVGPTGTALNTPPAWVAAPPQDSGAAAGEWALETPSGPPALVTPSSPVPASPFSTPPQVSSRREEEPSVMQDPGELLLPSVSAFDAPPATWGTRALAALGDQAGIGSSFGSQSTGEGPFDEVQARASESDPLVPSPSLGPPGGLDSRLRSPRPFALDETDETPLVWPAPTKAYPLEVGPGVRSRVSLDGTLAADLEAQSEVEQPRGDALLEDELVDSPDGARPTSPWPPDGTSGAYDRLGHGTGGVDGQPLPEPVPLVDDPSTSVAEAVAFVEDDTQSAPEAEAYLDDGGQPLDESGQPPPDSEIAALPEAAAPQVPRSLPPAPKPPSGDLARGLAPRRPAQLQASVPIWARSPDEPTARPGKRRLVWTIAVSVLGASVVAGGLAGFLVGSRGKPWRAIPGNGRPAALSGPQVVPPIKRVVPHDVEPQASPPSGNEAAAKTPESGTRRAIPAAQGAPSVAKKPGAEKPSAPTTPDKKIIGAGGAAPATLGRGVPGGAGQLVSVSVTSQPVGANVWINGKERGQTPLQVRLQSGPAHVVLVLAGHASAIVDVTASEGTQVSKELLAVAPPLTGDARFRAECSTQGKLPIVVDGKETGVLCPFTKLRVDPGVHRIGLFVPALSQVHEKEVTLHSGVRSIVFAD
jgi:serine/threonine-protein kinase